MLVTINGGGSEDSKPLTRAAAPEHHIADVVLFWEAIPKREKSPGFCPKIRHVEREIIHFLESGQHHEERTIIGRCSL